MTISIICAMGLNREIGKGNNLLWSLPNDLHHFKKLTTNKVCVLGRNTYESILSILGNPLQNRTNIVLTSDYTYATPYDNVFIYHNLEDVIHDYTEHGGNEEIFICGGEQVYKQFLPYADKLYLTIVHNTFDADTFFPAINDEWKVVSRQDNKADENNEYDYSFLIYEKQK